MEAQARERYSRQIVSPLIGEEGQRRLLESAVLIVGCGATGSFIASALARAGVGRLRLVDRDYVELSNLQRQTLYTEEDVERQTPKAVAARERLRAVNSGIQIEAVVTDIHSGNVEEYVEGVTLVMDGTDNLETRYLVNDACVKQGVPWVYSAAVASYGMSMFIQPEVTACLRCVFATPPPPGFVATCDTAGVLGPAAEAIASVSSRSAIKYLVGAMDLQEEHLTHLDLWELQLHKMRAPRRTGKEPCPCCVLRDFEYLRARVSSHTTQLCGRNAIQITLHRAGRLDLDALAGRLEPAGSVTRNAFLLRFRMDGYEMTVFPDGRAIIKGTTDEAVARSLYSRYVGM